VGGDFIVRSPTEVSFILGYKDGSDGVISYFDSTDGGQSFTKGDELLRRPKAGWALTALIEDAHPEARMIVASKVGKTSINTFNTIKSHILLIVVVAIYRCV